MKLLKTIYLGCNTKEVADINDCIIKFDAGSSGSHAIIIGRFASQLFKVQTLAQQGLITKPYRICVLIRKELVGQRYSPLNASSIDESIMWFAQNFQPPVCGVILSFYSYEDFFIGDIQQPYSTQVIWPFNNKLQAKRDGDYITYHKYPDNLRGRYSSKYSEALATGQVRIIDHIEKYTSIEAKEIDYTMSEDKIADLLMHSKMHFSYLGATYFFAGCTNTPTVCFGNPTEMSHISRWYEDGKTHKESVQVTMWGNYNYGARLPVTRVGQYDFVKQSVVQRPQRYVYHARTAVELEGILKGFPITFGDIEYSVDD